MSMKQMPSIAAALASAGAVLLAGAPLVLINDFGHLSQHMALHIVSMNVAAPVAAAMIVVLGAPRTIAPGYLWTVASVQILVLLFLHTPRFHIVAAHNPLTSIVVHALLTALAIGFWTTLLRLSPQQRWHAPAALLLTGKLACLLAAFLVFAPRPLYAALAHHSHGTAVSLADQQLAGLLMIVACPLSYLTAAILITVEMIGPQAAKTISTTDEGPRYAS
jgi:putative membrane protein